MTADPSTQDTTTAEPREFASLILEINKGRSHAELTTAVAELVAKVQETQRPGSMVYKLTMKPQPGDDEMVIIVDELTVKPPKGERGSSFFYIAEGHALSRKDPRQTDLFDA